MKVSVIGPINPPTSEAPQEPLPEFSTHVLRLKAGVKVTMEFNNHTGAFSCQWEPPPPVPKARFKKILPHYLKWRDGILAAYTQRTGRRIMVITA